MRNLKFNWQTDSFEIEDGNPVIVEEEDGIKAWIEQMIRTQKGAHSIYPDDYGTTVYDIFSLKLPKPFIISSLENDIQTSSKYVDEIFSVSRLSFDGYNQIDFNVELKE